jgi:hypothetical protein
LAVTQLAEFMTLLDLGIVNVALPSMERGLGASAGTVQWVVSGYALAAGLSLVPAGRVGDTLGRRRSRRQSRPAASYDHDGRGHPSPHTQRGNPARYGPFATCSPLNRARRPVRSAAGLHHPGQQLQPEADRHSITQPAVGPYDGQILRSLAALPTL